MKSFLKVLFLLIIVLGVASPFGAGYVLEKQYNDMIVQLNKAYKNEIVFTGKFQRGFMGSTATTELSVNGAPIETLQHVVHHGPVIFSFGGWLSPSTYVPRGYGLAKVDTILTGNLAKKISSIYADKTAYNISTMVDFNGNSATTIINYPLTTQLGVGVLKWQGITANFNIDKHVTKISGTALIPELEYSEPSQSSPGSESVKVNNLTLEFNKIVSDGSSMLSVNLADFKILNPTAEELGVTDLNLIFNKTGIDKIQGGELKTTFSKLHLLNHDLGPFSLDVKTNNIDYSAMTAIMYANKQRPTNIPDDQLIAMLSTKPTLDVDLKVTMPEGKIDYVGHAEAGGPDITSAAPAVIIPTIKMSQQVQISSKIVTKLLTRYIQQLIHENEKMYFEKNKTSTIMNPWTMTPEQLQTMSAKLVANIIDTLKTKQYIIEEDEVISCAMRFENSVLTINGVEHSNAEIEQLRALFELKAPVPTEVLEPTEAPAAAVEPATTIDPESAVVDPEPKTQPTPATTSVIQEYYGS